jgi:hypothetical protein
MKRFKIALWIDAVDLQVNRSKGNAKKKEDGTIDNQNWKASFVSAWLLLPVAPKCNIFSSLTNPNIHHQVEIDYRCSCSQRRSSTA